MATVNLLAQGRPPVEGCSTLNTTNRWSDQEWHWLMHRALKAPSVTGLDCEIFELSGAATSGQLLDGPWHLLTGGLNCQESLKACTTRDCVLCCPAAFSQPRI